MTNSKPDEGERMTDNRDESDIQNSGISNEPETAIQNAVPTEGKTLLHSEIVIDERETSVKFFERSLAQKRERRFASASEMKGSLLNPSFVINKTE